LIYLFNIYTTKSYAKYTVNENEKKKKKKEKLQMWVNAQRDGRPAEYRWRPLFNAAKFG